MSSVLNALLQSKIPKSVIGRALTYAVFVSFSITFMEIFTGIGWNLYLKSKKLTPFGGEIALFHLFVDILLTYLIANKLSILLTGKSQPMLFWIGGILGIIVSKAIEIKTYYYFAEKWFIYRDPKGLDSIESVILNNDIRSILCLLIGSIGYFICSMLTYLIPRARIAIMDKGNIKKILFVIILIHFPSTKYCFNSEQHRSITIDSINTVISNGKYDEIAHIANRAQIQNGAVNEDIQLFDFKGFNHFYNPVTTFGLWGKFQSALESLNGQVPILSKYWYQEAIEKYKIGEKEIAYERLGHVLHLVSQDMCSVPHVFDDGHAYDLVSFDAYADSSNVLGDERRLGHDIPEILINIGDELIYNAEKTYKICRIKGDLHKSITNPASGNLGQMFDVNYFQEIIYYKDQIYPETTYDGSVIISDVWKIQNVGDCWEYSGYNQYGQESDDWWVARNFNDDVGKYFYFENPICAKPKCYPDLSGNCIQIPENIDNNPSNGKSLAEIWALGISVGNSVLGPKLLAKSREVTAGLIKKFAKEVDDKKPTFTPLDVNDNPINLSSFKGGFLKVVAVDTGNPTASGIYKISLNDEYTNKEVPFDSHSEWGNATVTCVWSNIPSGMYSLHVCDGLGNETGQIVDACAFNASISIDGSKGVERIYVGQGKGDICLMVDRSVQDET